MTDTDKQPDPAGERPTMIRVEMDAGTIRRIAELEPAIALWAESEGEAATGPGDVIALAVATLHAQVLNRANELIAAGEVQPATRH